MKKAMATKISGKLSLILAGSNFITCAEAEVTTVVNKDVGFTFIQEIVGVLMLRSIFGLKTRKRKGSR